MRSILLIVLFVVASQFVLADGVQPSGSGTETDPYLVVNLDNLLWLSTTPDVWDDNSYFLQTADIDASDTENWNGGEGFNPIAYWNLPFTGHYDGQDYEITNLFFNNADSFQITIMGLWTYALNSTFANIKLTSFDFSVPTISWGICGGLAGTIGNTVITNCHVSGNLYGAFAGGLIGYACNGSIVSRCSSKVNINSQVTGGGLACENSNSYINDCFYYGIMDTTSGNCGGLVGVNSNSSILSNSYSLVANNPINVHALVGLNSGLIENCVWSSDINSLGACFEDSTSILTNVIDCTEAQMRDVTTYTNLFWDFYGETNNGTEDIWTINPVLNNGYPYLVALEQSVGIDEEIGSQPQMQTALFNAYPNPFNPTTTISFDVAKNDRAELSIYNIRGQLVKNYKGFTEGKHQIVWEGLDKKNKKCASGVYFYRLKSKITNDTKKMILMK